MPGAQYQPGGTIAVKHTDSPKTVYAVWEESDPQPPLIPAPSYDDLKSAIGQIQVKDVSTPSCGTENYDLIDNTQSEPFNWTKTARADQPGKYDVTIKTAPYVAKYNSEKTKTHELNNANQTTLKLVISYEITVRWAGSHPENPLVKVVLWPGMQMQYLTTNEPDDGMLECAIAAMQQVLEREELEAAKAAAAARGAQA